MAHQVVSLSLKATAIRPLGEDHWTTLGAAEDAAPSQGCEDFRSEGGGLGQEAEKADYPRGAGAGRNCTVTPPQTADSYEDSGTFWMSSWCQRYNMVFPKKGGTPKCGAFPVEVIIQLMKPQLHGHMFVGK